MENITIFDALIDIVDNSVDEEVIANSLKTIRFIFKHASYMFYVGNQSPETINRIIQVLLSNGNNQFIKREVYQIVSLYVSLS